MATAVQMPFENFLDTDGTPLNNGKIYIGTVNQNPITNPITVYWDQALTIPASQPIRTLGGFPSRQGTAASVFVTDDYSIIIRNQNDVTLFSQLTGSPFSASALLAKLKTVDGSGSGLIAEGLQSVQITDLNFDPSLLGLAVRETRIYTTSSGPANQFTGMSTTFYTIQLTRTDTNEYRVIVTGGTASDDMWTRVWSTSWGTAFRFTSEYDLVVDSNTALDAWVNDTSGNMKRVLIKSGTWTSSVTAPSGGIFINLDAGGPGTVYARGEPGSSIVFSTNSASAVYGFFHATLPTSNQQNAEKFDSVSMTLTNAGAGTTSSFYRCSNLINCTSTVTAQVCVGFRQSINLFGCVGTISGSSASASSSFSESTKLTNCRGVSTNTAGISYAFATCTYLSGCNGTSTAGAATLNATAFIICDYVSTCQSIGVGLTTGTGKAFDTCTYLSSCSGTATSGNGGVAVGFDTCSNLTECTGVTTNTGKPSLTGTAFLSCTSLSNCSGTGTGGDSFGGDGKGFASCIQVIGCRGVGLAPLGLGYGFFGCQQCQSNRALAASKTATYNTSFADTATNATAATAAGGYNIA